METELKLLIAPEDLARLPELVPLHGLCEGGARIERLHTRYYDTPARDLARAGIALRVRRAGEAWIQTLKAGGRSAGGLHERVELEWTLYDATPDFDRLSGTPYEALFADPQLRAALQPVYETEFERVALQLAWPDGARAELALDRGEVRAGDRSATISEAEIELIAGEPARLFELAAALAEYVPVRLGHRSKAERGDALATDRKDTPTKAQPVELSPELSVADALSRIGLACLAQMQANEAGVLEEDADSEYLHQFRVGLRRLRALVGLFRFVAPKSAYEDTAKALRALGKSLAKARDWDVYVGQMLPAAELPAPHAETLATGAERRRAKHRAKAREALRAPAYGKLMLKLAQRFNDPVLGMTEAGGGKRIALDAPVGELAAAALDRYDRKLRKAGARLAEADDDARHALRLRAKRLRYIAEFFAALYPAEGVQPYVDALHDVQKALGAFNDVVRFRRLSKKAAGDDGDARDAAKAWAAQRRERELERSDKRWQAFVETPRFWS